MKTTVIITTAAASAVLIYLLLRKKFYNPNAYLQYKPAKPDKHHITNAFTNAKKHAIHHDN